MTDLLNELLLSRGCIHVWIAPLSMPFETINSYRDLLSMEELGRANSFRFEKDRNKYLIGKGLTRTLLSKHYLNIDSRQIDFLYSRNGKPYLKEDINPDQVVFNVSHSHELVTIAVAVDKILGIDVEYLRHIDDLEAIVFRFFSEVEKNWFGKIPKEKTLDAFYFMWTRKEAYTKSLGMGLGENLVTSVITNGHLSGKDSIIEEKTIVSEWIFFSYRIQNQYQLSIAVKEKKGSFDDYYCNLFYYESV